MTKSQKYIVVYVTQNVAKNQTNCSIVNKWIWYKMWQNIKQIVVNTTHNVTNNQKYIVKKKRLSRTFKCRGFNVRHLPVGLCVRLPIKHGAVIRLASVSPSVTSMNADSSQAGKTRDALSGGSGPFPSLMAKQAATRVEAATHTSRKRRRSSTQWRALV